MHITVLGARGSIGRHVIEQAVQQGHEVTAFTRDPSRVALRHEQLEIATGDAADPAGVRSAVSGRLACQSTIGVGDSRGNLTPFWKYVMFGAVLRPAFGDHVRQKEVVRASGLDWTIVRPGAFLLAQVTEEACLRRAVPLSY